MSRVWALAVNTFREAVRDRVLYSILFFAIGVLALSLAIDDITIGDQAKVVRSVAQGAVDVFASIIAMFLGVSVIHKELERKTVYTVLSRPLRRSTFILGKYAGLLLTVFVEVLVLVVVYSTFMWIRADPPGLTLYVSMGMLLVELALLTAWATLFSAYSAPTTAAAFTLAVFVIGHLADDIWLYGSQSKTPSVQAVARALYWALPNFELLSIRQAAVHQDPVPWVRVWPGIAYGLGYTTAVLAAAMAVFQRKDVK
jgi:ABC-type transport system involved in multi-copper enzyme maturation permease subunit